MKKLICVLATLFLAAPAQAALVCSGQACTFDRVPLNNHVLQKELVDAGYGITVSGISCRNIKCRITFLPSVPLNATVIGEIEAVITFHVYIDYAQRRINRRAAIKPLVHALRAKSGKTDLEKMMLYLFRQFGMGE